MCSRWCSLTGWKTWRQSSSEDGRGPLADPLAEEVVVVQSPGMALWLRTEQAKAFGIAAGVAYPLPSLFAWRLIRTLVPAPADDPYAKRNLRWTLFGLLAALPQDARHAPLRHYLEGGEQGLKRFQLAERIADLFDQYLVYRPSWLAAWRRGQRLGLPGPHECLAKRPLGPGRGRPRRRA